MEESVRFGYFPKRCKRPMELLHMLFNTQAGNIVITISSDFLARYFEQSREGNQLSAEVARRKGAVSNLSSRKKVLH